MDGSSRTISLSLHIAALALALWWHADAPKTPPEATRQVTHLVAPFTRKSAGGGGGGAHQPDVARKGVLPLPSPHVFLPPVIATVRDPILPTQITMDIPPEVPVKEGQIGDPAGLDSLSAGPGGLAGIGGGKGGTIGGRTGSSYGQEPGDGVYSMGSGATAPVVVHREEPEYSEMARKARLSGSVYVYAEIGPDGKPHRLRVTHGLGAGLDEKALEAVARWLFRPGSRNGKPVTVRATFEVNFRLL